MTEAEWLACADPSAMLIFLQDKATKPQLRLFACACCRRIWHLLEGENEQNAVELAERLDDPDYQLRTLFGLCVFRLPFPISAVRSLWRAGVLQSPTMSSTQWPGRHPTGCSA